MAASGKTPDSSSRSGRGAETGAEPSAAPEGAPTEDSPALSPQDEVRRRFREALERKRGAHEAQGDGAAKDTARGGSEAHGPARTQRSFRRRAGG